MTRYVINTIAKRFRTPSTRSVAFNGGDNQFDVEYDTIPSQTMVKRELQTSVDPLPSFNGDGSNLEWDTIHSGEFAMSIDDLHDLMWSENAQYSIEDFYNEHPGNRDIEVSQWRSTEDDCLERNHSLLTKIDNLPSFVSKLGTVPSESQIERIERCGKSQSTPDAFIIHRRTRALNVPYGAYYAMHEKWNFRESRQIIENGDGVKQCVVSSLCTVDFACEWIESCWFQSQIRSQLAKKNLQDIERWFETAQTKIQEWQISEKEDRAFIALPTPLQSQTGFRGDFLRRVLPLLNSGFVYT